MTFEKWWHSITTSEQRFLGRNYAEYIWRTAQQAKINELREQNLLKEERESHYDDGRQPRLL